jgi:seryl-tRNA synthetase
MLDPKFIRDNIEEVKKAAKNKGIRFDHEAFLSIFEQRSQQIETTEVLRRKRNEGADLVKNTKDKEKREQIILEMREVGQQLGVAEAQLRDVEANFEKILLQVPSIPSADTPIGASDLENVEWRKWGQPRTFDFDPKDHIELGESLQIVDFQRGTAIAGSRSYVLTGVGAELERAVHSLAYDLLRSRGYTAMSVPVLVKSSAMQGTGYLPGGEDQAYFVEKDDMWLVGTSEVPLASYHAGEILDAAKLPLKFFAHSSCFRREAGAHGKDTKGLYRVHQFQKIEQVILCQPTLEASDALHTELLTNAEDLLQLLELPYRVVKVCTGDLGQGQVKKHDIETWMPSRKGYGETHSCSSFLDYQARRLKIRCKDASGKPQFAYTLNNTLAATPRLLIPLIENHQQADGSVKIPVALQKYLGGLAKIDLRSPK